MSAANSKAALITCRVISRASCSVGIGDQGVERVRNARHDHDAGSHPRLSSIMSLKKHTAAISGVEKPSYPVLVVAFHLAASSTPK
jgi:hypothetical protein